MYAYVDTFEQKVEKAGMKAREIGQALCLKRTPDFRKPTEKACFCSLRSNDMQLIKKLYDENDSENIEAEVAKKKWISELVKLMQALNWSSSINDLPQDKSISRDDEMLLWNASVICDNFMCRDESE